MADTITGVTEITAASLAEISQEAQVYLQQRSMLLPTVTDYSYLAQAGVKSVAIPRAGGFTVGEKGENVSVDSQAITFATDTIALTNHRVVQFLIEDDASLKAKVNIVAENTLRAAADLAADVDNFIIAELKLASTTAPDHKLVFAATTTDIVAKADILASRKLLIDQHIDPRECYIGVGSEKEAELLAISDFIDASKYGSNEPIMNGEIGKIYGMRVLVHSAFADFMCSWHPSAVGFAFQRNLKFQSQMDLANLGMRYSLDMIHGAEVLDLGKRNVFTDSTN